MSYRRNSESTRLWRQWKAKNKTLLDQCGLPEMVLEDELSWLNYLDHGFFEHFQTEDLSQSQMKSLAALLESEISEQERQTLLVWLELNRLLTK